MYSLFHSFVDHSFMLRSCISRYAQAHMPSAPTIAASIPTNVTLALTSPSTSEVLPLFQKPTPVYCDDGDDDDGCSCCYDNHDDGWDDDAEDDRYYYLMLLLRGRRRRRRRLLLRLGYDYDPIYAWLDMHICRKAAFNKHCLQTDPESCSIVTVSLRRSPQHRTAGPAM